MANRDPKLILSLLWAHDMACLWTQVGRVVRVGPGVDGERLRVGTLVFAFLAHGSKHIIAQVRPVSRLGLPRRLCTWRTPRHLYV